MGNSDGLHILTVKKLRGRAWRYRGGMPSKKAGGFEKSKSFMLSPDKPSETPYSSFGKSKIVSLSSELQDPERVNRRSLIF